MKKSIWRWSIDACFFMALAWGFGWLFYIITGVFELFYRILLYEQMATVRAILLLVIFPLLIGLIMSSIFTFISIKFHPSIGIYILICALLVILPTLPYVKSIIPRFELSDEFGIFCYLYVAFGMLLSGFVYDRIKSISNVTPPSS